MAVQANIAPFINVPFYVTGMYGVDRGDHIHVGLDIATSGGSPLYSMVNGTVIYNEYNNVRGWVVITKSNETGIAFLYQHLAEQSPIQVGESVVIGQLIGQEGTTGESTGIHLHLEQQDLSTREWYFGNDISYYINPCDFMGIPNVTGTECIYNGTPIIPPTPIIPSTIKKFKWAVFTNKIRKRRK